MIDGFDDGRCIICLQPWITKPLCPGSGTAKQRIWKFISECHHDNGKYLPGYACDGLSLRIAGAISPGRQFYPLNARRDT